MPTCSVFCCRKRSGTSSLQTDGITFHRFPKDPRVRELWILFCNNKRTWMPPRAGVICSEHFKIFDFRVLANKRRLLLEGTIPTLIPHCTCVSHQLSSALSDDQQSPSDVISTSDPSMKPCASSTPLHVKIPTFKLNNGREIPAVGYGTFLGMDDKLDVCAEDLPKMKEALSYAIDIGYRHIDTAHFYRVEPSIGQIINKKIQDGVVKREDIFVTTKVWHHMHREADVEKSVRDSLKRSKLDYFDLVLVHWPMAISEEGVDEKIDYLETWRGFENILAKGLTKTIGVSNFNLEQMKRLLTNCKVPPAINQIEINLNLGQKELVDYCQSQNVVVVAFSPFGTMTPYRAAEGTPEPKLNNPVMVAMGKKYGKSVTQITLRYLYQRGIVSIPKTISTSRVLENASIFDFELDSGDMSKLAAFDVNYRTVAAYFWQDYEYYPFDKIDTNLAIPPSHLHIEEWDA